MTIAFYEWICLRLLEVKEFAKTEIWCARMVEQYPLELAAYTCRLKLYFTLQQKERFFQVMEELKGSGIVIDSETLELIRTLPDRGKEEGAFYVYENADGAAAF